MFPTGGKFMKKTNKLLALFLALVMVVSAMSLSLVANAAVNADKLTADPAETITQGYVTNDGNANGYNATLLLDFLDYTLKNMEKKIKFTANFIIAKITIDLTSVDGLLQTVDTLKNNSGLLKRMGSLENLNVKNWKTGQTRAKTGDWAILNNLVQFIADNSEIIRLVINGDFTAGAILDPLIESVADVKVNNLLPSLLGSDLYTYIKGLVAGLCYDKDTEKAKYDACVAKTLDDIIFVDLLTVGLNKQLAKWDAQIKETNAGKTEGMAGVINYLYTNTGFKLEGALAGFTYDKNKTLDALISDVADVIYANNYRYIAALAAEYGETLNEFIFASEYGAPFRNLIDFTKLADESKLAFTNTQKSIKGLNDFVGKFVGILTTYTGWSASANLGKNIQDLAIWAISNRDTTVDHDPYAGVTGTDFASYAMSFAKMIVATFVTDAEAVSKMNDCKTTEDVLTILLPYLMNKDASVVSAKSTKWEQVLGDILGYYLNPLMPLYTDAANTKRYQVASSTPWTDVLNYAANYYLVDLNLDTVFGLSLTKSQSIYEKLDAVQATLFKGVTTLEYVKASKMIPALINDIMTLSLDGVVSEFEGAFCNINTSVSASNLIYALLDNVLKAVTGQEVFPAKFTSLDYMIKDDSIADAAKVLLNGINNRKADLLPVVLYWFSTLSDVFQFSATVADGMETTVNYGGKSEIKNDDGSVKRTDVYNVTLVKGTDYTVSAVPSGTKGTTTVSVVGKGNYAGTLLVGNCKCTSHSYTVTKAATTKAAGTKTCKYCGATASIASPKTVTLKYTSTAYTGKALKPTVTVKDSAKKTISASNYTVSYKNNKNVGKATVTIKFKGSYSGSLTANFNIVPAQVKGLKAASATANTIKLSWTKVTGAKYYEVYQSTNGKKWTKVATVSTNSATVKKLKAGTGYQFKVRALDSSKKLIGAYSAVLKTGTATAAPKIATLKSTKAKTATVTWKKVSGAKSYVIYTSTDGKKFKKAGTAKKTTFTISKLTSKKKIYVKVAAVNSYKFESAQSAAKNVKVK